MYEYRIEMFRSGGLFFGKVNKFQTEATLNELAKQGWEVVTSASLNRFFGETHNLVYTLRRKILNEILNGIKRDYLKRKFRQRYSPTFWRVFLPQPMEVFNLVQMIFKKIICLKLPKSCNYESICHSFAQILDYYDFLIISNSILPSFWKFILWSHDFSFSAHPQASRRAKSRTS